MTIHPLDLSPAQAPSPTAHVIRELQLHGYRASDDEPDPRPLPDDDIMRSALNDMFDVLVTTLMDKRLEPDLEDLLWSTVNLYHRATARVQRELDRNEDAQRHSQAEQDGSEVRSVELQRFIVTGTGLIERRGALEAFRDHAAELFASHTGSAWHPRLGSRVNHRALTAAMIDSRDFIAVKRRVETEPLTPAGTRIAFTGGLDCNDYHAIWAVLDRAHAKYPDMVVLHGASPKGAELIASKWADGREVTQIAFRPHWTRHGRPRRLSAMTSFFQTVPIGLIVFQARASPRTSPTKRARSAYRCGGVLKPAHIPVAQPVLSADNTGRTQ